MPGHAAASYAVSLNKRFAPIVHRAVDDRSVPEALARINHIDFVNRPFEERVGRPVKALNTDIDWIRQHTEFGEAARRWALAKTPAGLRLGSPALEEAEHWISTRPEGAPSPTQTTLAFVTAGRRETTPRRNVLTGSLAAGLVLALALAGFGYWQRNAAVEQERLAEQHRRIAEEQRTIAQRNEQQAKEQRDHALLNHSRFLADLANQQTDKDDAGTGMLLVLEASPDARSPASRPYTPEAESALFHGRMRVHEVQVLNHNAAEV